MQIVIWVGAKVKSGFAAVSDATAGIVVIALVIVLALAIAF